MFPFLHPLRLLLGLTLVLTFFSKNSNGRMHAIPCMNNGTFAMEGSKRVCHCPYQFTGRFCEDYACVNGLSTGEQFDSSSLFFNRHCLCDAGWTGELCDTSLINRCGDNGKEQKGKCVCNENFIGDRCNYVTKCSHGQLYNGRCSCHYGWAGDFCDKIICHQGKPDEKNELCICPSKHRGRYCDFCADPASSPPPECARIGDGQFIQIEGDNIPVIMAIAIMIALIILGAVFYLFCYMMSRSNRALNIIRQTSSDVKNTLPVHERETCPLHGSNYVTGEELVIDLEKFHDAPPPPYDAIAQLQQQAFVQQDLTDSGFFHLTDATDKSNRTSSEIGSSSAETSLKTANKDVKQEAASPASKLSV